MDAVPALDEGADLYEVLFPRCVLLLRVRPRSYDSGGGGEVIGQSPRYRTIVADPPWEYEPFVSINRTAGKWSERVEKPLPYAAMSIPEIAALPVGDLADTRGAFLFLWTTNRYLPCAFSILEDWGFSYRQTLVWHKVNGTPLGGSFAPNHAEYLLACRRGNVRRSDKLPSSVISIRHNAKTHSKKPDAFLDLIESISPGPYLELFARRQRLGWDTWGNESLQHVSLLAEEAS